MGILALQRPWLNVKALRALANDLNLSDLLDRALSEADQATS